MAIKCFQSLGLIIIVLVLLYCIRCYFRKNVSAVAPISTKQEMKSAFLNKRKSKKSKSVRFRPMIEVRPAGGEKGDRFNPDYKPGVQRNMMQASQVGSVKKLVALELSNSH